MWLTGSARALCHDTVTDTDDGGAVHRCGLSLKGVSRLVEEHIAQHVKQRVAVSTRRHISQTRPHGSSGAAIDDITAAVGTRPAPLHIALHLHCRQAQGLLTPSDAAEAAWIHALTYRCSHRCILKLHH
jgi:hypothetical protein